MAHKTIGNAPILPIECISLMKNKWKARWSVVQIDDSTYEWVEETYDHKPTEEEVRLSVNNWVNTHVKEKITSGFTWNGMQVWLSIENQMNYKAIYDLAIQGNEGILPITFKFGTDESPVFYTFDAVDELSDFYTKAMKHIHDCLSEGWTSKEDIDKLFS